MLVSIFLITWYQIQELL